MLSLTKNTKLYKHGDKSKSAWREKYAFKLTSTFTQI